MALLSSNDILLKRHSYLNVEHLIAELNGDDVLCEVFALKIRKGEKAQIRLKDSYYSTLTDLVEVLQSITTVKRDDLFIMRKITNPQTRRYRNGKHRRDILDNVISIEEMREKGKEHGLSPTTIERHIKENNKLPQDKKTTNFKHNPIPASPIRIMGCEVSVDDRIKKKKGEEFQERISGREMIGKLRSSGLSGLLSLNKPNKKKRTQSLDYSFDKFIGRLHPIAAKRFLLWCRKKWNIKAYAISIQRKRNDRMFLYEKIYLPSECKGYLPRLNRSLLLRFLIAIEESKELYIQEFREYPIGIHKVYFLKKRVMNQ